MSYCTGNAGALPGSGWRLPSKTELQTIVDDSQHNPAIDPNAFPGTPSNVFWTSSAYAPSPGYAWFVYFDGGATSNNVVATSSWVRCVR